MIIFILLSIVFALASAATPSIPPCRIHKEEIEGVATIPCSINVANLFPGGNIFAVTPTAQDAVIVDVTPLHDGIFVITTNITTTTVLTFLGKKDEGTATKPKTTSSMMYFKANRGPPLCHNTTISVKPNEEKYVPLVGWINGTNLVSPPMTVTSSVTRPLEAVTKKLLDNLYTVKFTHGTSESVVINFTITSVNDELNTSCQVVVSVLDSSRDPIASSNFNMLWYPAEDASSPHLIPVELHAEDPNHLPLKFIITDMPTKGYLCIPKADFLKTYENTQNGSPLGPAMCRTNITNETEPFEQSKYFQGYVVVLYGAYMNKAEPVIRDTLRFQATNGVAVSNIVKLPLNVIRNHRPQCIPQEFTVTAGQQTTLDFNGVRDDDALQGDVVITSVLRFPRLGVLRTRNPDVSIDVPWNMVNVTHPILGEKLVYLVPMKHVGLTDTFTFQARDTAGDWCSDEGVVTVHIVSPSNGDPVLLDYTSESNVVCPSPDNPNVFSLRVSKAPGSLCVVYSQNITFDGPLCVDPVSTTPAGDVNFNTFNLIGRASKDGPDQALVLLRINDVVFHRLYFNVTLTKMAPTASSSSSPTTPTSPTTTTASPLSPATPSSTPTSPPSVLPSTSPLPPSSSPALTVVGGSQLSSSGSSLSVVACLTGNVKSSSFYLLDIAPNTATCNVSSTSVPFDCGSTRVNVKPAFLTVATSATSACTGVQVVIPLQCSTSGTSNVSVGVCYNNTTALLTSTAVVVTLQDATQNPPAPTPTDDNPNFRVPSEASSSSGSLMFIILFVVMAGVVVLFWQQISGFFNRLLRGTSDVRAPLRNVTTVTTSSHHTAGSDHDQPSRDNQHRVAVISNAEQSGWDDVPWDDDSPQIAKEEMKPIKPRTGKHD
eukprot:PhF_6_TR44126/c0_g1_i2/m.67389